MEELERTCIVPPLALPDQSADKKLGLRSISKFMGKRRKKTNRCHFSLRPRQVMDQLNPSNEIHSGGKVTGTLNLERHEAQT